MNTSDKRERRNAGRCARRHSANRAGRPLSDSALVEAFNYFEAKRVRNEAVELLTLVKPSGSAFSHLAAKDLKGCAGLIHRAAKEDRKEFFIELGKLLEGKRLKPNPWTKLDNDVAFILCRDPKIKSTKAVKLLKNLGHPKISPAAFKQKKYNWKRAATKRRQLWEKAGYPYIGNSFLDNTP